MIDATQRKKLKRYLKGDYSDAVIQILNERGKKTKFGKSFSADVVRQVFNGQFHSQAVVEAIYELYTRRKNNDLQQKELLK